MPKRNGGAAAAAAPSASSSPPSKRRQPSALLSKYKTKLAGAKFRLLNEALYTSTGEQAKTSFSSAEFDLYHQGFAEQTKSWPTNPVDVIITKYLKSTRGLVVGDLGCGDARIARETQERHSVHSFDLVACNESVVACDMSHVPLESGSLDMAVYSLSLMGVNASDFLVEAYRLLRPQGKLIIAEVKSRFAFTKGPRGMQDGLADFYASLGQLGFDLVEADVDSNKMFVVLAFVKSAARRPVLNTTVRLKACEYKRR